MVKRFAVLYAPDEPPAGGAAPVPAATPEPAAPTPAPATPEPASAAAEPPAAEAAPMVPLKALTETQRKFQEARERAAYLEGQLAAAQRPAESAAPSQPDGPPQEPNIDDFPDDYSAFERAQRRYIVDVAKYELKQEHQQAQTQAAQVQTQQQIETNWRKAVTTAQEKYPDFMDTISNPDFRQSASVADAIKSSEIGGDVAYFLAKNLDVANSLNAMSPIQAAREIGKIEAKLMSAPKPTPPPVISQAPEPISTVVPGDSGVTVELKDLPMDDYFKARAPKIFHRR